MSITIRTAASPARVSTYLQDNQTNPQAAALADGGYVVVWTSHSQTGQHGQGDIYSQRYDAAGAAIGVETLVNTVLDGTQGTPIAAWNWDRLLGQQGTGRNWRTVQRLADLATAVTRPG